MGAILKRESFCTGCKKGKTPYPCMVFNEALEEKFRMHGEESFRAKLNDLHTRIIGELYDVLALSRDDTVPSAGCTYYTRDGFMPGYTKVSKRVLFIGRESRWSKPNPLDPENNPSDIIQNTHYRLEADKTFQIERRMIAVAAQILSPGVYFSYDDIVKKNWPFVRQAALNGEISFAYLELSKFSNCNDDSNVDWQLMNQYAEFDAIHLFGKQQIELLQPDIIVTMNMKRYFFHPLQVMLGSNFTAVDEEITQDIVPSIWKVKAPWDPSRSIPVLDMWHFSSRKPNNTFFDPIQNALQMNLL